MGEQELLRLQVKAVGRACPGIGEEAGLLEAAEQRQGLLLRKGRRRRDQLHRLLLLGEHDIRIHEEGPQAAAVAAGD